MSAYVCENDTIDLIASAAKYYDLRIHGLSGCIRPARGPLAGPGTAIGSTDAATIARALWAENVYSVRHRYDEDGSVVDFYRFTPVNLESIGHDPLVVVLGSIRCLRYQSCESPDYAHSAGARILDAIEHEIVRKLTAAVPWGWTRAWSAERKAQIACGISRTGTRQYVQSTTTSRRAARAESR